MEHKNIAFIIEEKNIQENGYFEGYGSTFTEEPDSYGDVIRKGAYKKTLEAGGRNGNGVAMLYQHNSQRPVGVWEEICEDNIGLYVKGKLIISTTDGKDVYELMKAGALRGLSIGYDTIKYSFSKDKKIKFLEEINLWEISPVTFPANRDATITGVKKVIEEAKTQREFENALRESGLSKSSAQYITKLCDFSALRESGQKTNIPKNSIGFNNILDKLVFENTMLGDFVKKDLAEDKRVIPFRSFPTLPIRVIWDGVGEIKKANIKDLKIICAWHDIDNLESKEAYKLPHHKADGYTVVWKGVVSAMAALLGARGGVNIPKDDRRGVYNHLAKHYKQFDKKPPDFKNYSNDELIEIFPGDVGWSILLANIKNEEYYKREG